MTRKLLALFLPILLLTFASVANAQTTTTGSAQTTTTSVASKLKQQMQLLEDEKKTAVSKIRDDAKALIQTKRDDFKAKLQTIKDLKKKTLVEKIDAKITETNKNQTTKFSEALVRIQEFLDKVSKSATGTAVLANVAAAQTAINTAKAAVEAQAGKTYTMTIASDSTLKLNAGITTSQLRQDLMTVYKLVISAKQAVHKLNTDNDLLKKEATGSARL